MTAQGSQEAMADKGQQDKEQKTGQPDLAFASQLGVFVAFCAVWLFGATAAFLTRVDADLWLRPSRLRTLVLGLLVFSALGLDAQKNGIELLAQMHKRYQHGICQYYTFSQKNAHYENDSLVGNSVWHESVGLPDKFRIVFGDSAKGNSVLFRNDSVYRYKGNTVRKADRDSNTLLLLLGGMYYRELDDVKRRLVAAGFDLQKLSEQQWLKRPVYVIGAMTGDEGSNQLWVDKQDLRVVRIIERMNGTDMMDMRFESHRKWCNGFVEDKVSFRRNGDLEQVEEYYDLKERDRFW